jgi:hypothetical protein
MNRRKISFAVVSAVLAVVIIILLLKKPPSQSISAIKAIPTNTGIIIKLNGFLKFFDALSENQYWQSIRDDSIKIFLNHVKSSIDNICLKNPDLEKFFKDSSVYISVHPNVKKPLGVLFYIPIEQGFPLKRIYKILSSFSTSGRALLCEFKPASYNKNQIRIKKNVDYYFFFEKGLLVIGNNNKNISEAYWQAKSKRYLLSDSTFSKVYNTTGKNVTGNVFVNYSRLPGFVMDYFKPEFRDDLKIILNINGWASYDLILNPSVVSLHGFSSIDNPRPFWARLIKSDIPVENTIAEVLPSSTVLFCITSTNDSYNYKILLKNAAKFDFQLQNKMRRVNEKFRYNVVDSILKILSGAVVLNVCKQNTDDYQVYCILKTLNIITARDFIWTFYKHKPKKGKNNPENISSIENLFCTLPDNSLPEALFGKEFGFAKFPVACSYKEYLIFGETEGSLKTYISEIETHHFLVNDTNFKNITANQLSLKANFSVYLNFSKCVALLTEGLIHGFRENFERNYLNCASNTLFGFQLSGNGQYIYSNTFLYSLSIPYKGPELKWSTALDTAIASPIIAIPGPGGYECNYFVQDWKTNIYIISSKGNILWKKRLDEKILGNIYSFESKKNNKSYVFFSTAEKLYCFDMNGKSGKGYPVTYKQTATTGITYVNFKDNRSERCYTAFSNRQLIAMTIDGKKISGWKFDKTEGKANDPIQHFNHDGKDYLLFSDLSYIYLVNRKGELQFKTANSLHQSKNNTFTIDEKSNYFRFLTTDTNGNICFIYPDKHIEKSSVGQFSKDHFFKFEDINGDGSKEYLFADSSFIYAYNQNNKLIFRTKLDVIIDQTPIITTNKNNEAEIFVCSSASGKLYMIYPDGKIAKGFPINGNSPMNVISLSNDKYSFAVLTGDGNILHYYSIK